MFKCPICKMTALAPPGLVSGIDYLRNHLYEYHPIPEYPPPLEFTKNNFNNIILLDQKI